MIHLIELHALLKEAGFKVGEYADHTDHSAFRSGVKDAVGKFGHGGKSNKSRIVAVAQSCLKQLGFNPGPIDGIWGPRTAKALNDWFRHQGRLSPWPTEREVPDYFGKRGENQIRMRLPYKMRLAWEPTVTISSFMCHRLVAGPLQAIFEQTLEHYGASEIPDLGLDQFGGCLNVRKKRGSRREWSMHSWGIAVDLDPVNNRLRWDAGQARLAQPIYEPFWEIVESVGGVSYGRTRNRDWMHFQFARRN